MDYWNYVKHSNDLPLAERYKELWVEFKAKSDEDALRKILDAPNLECDLGCRNKPAKSDVERHVRRQCPRKSDAEVREETRCRWFLWMKTELTFDRTKREYVSGSYAKIVT